MCDTHPLQNLGTLTKVSNLRGREGRDMEMAKWVIERGLTAYEATVSKMYGKFSYGDKFTVADVVLAAQHYNGVAKYEVDMAPFPCVTKIMEAVYAEPCMRDSHPKLFKK
ncbi:hypothetical protein BC830DRAFT_1150978 [Chytriomyces sp. MP71]|nr:hypothetical protein BC830DRAFT_1150978 [Chytriomyces sp. MP71]